MLQSPPPPQQIVYDIQEKDLDKTNTSTFSLPYELNNDGLETKMEVQNVMENVFTYDEILTEEPLESISHMLPVLNNASEVIMPNSSISDNTNITNTNTHPLSPWIEESDFSELHSNKSTNTINKMNAKDTLSLQSQNLKIFNGEYFQNISNISDNILENLLTSTQILQQLRLSTETYMESIIQVQGS